MFKRLFKNWFMTDQERIEKYLSESVDLVDLERRQKELRLRGFNA
jgi:Protein of unknown function (DUF3563)